MKASEENVDSANECKDTLSYLCAFYKTATWILTVILATSAERLQPVCNILIHLLVIISIT